MRAREDESRANDDADGDLNGSREEGKWASEQVSKGARKQGSKGANE